MKTLSKNSRGQARAMRGSPGGAQSCGSMAPSVILLELKLGAHSPNPLRFQRRLRPRACPVSLTAVPRSLSHTGGLGRTLTRTSRDAGLWGRPWERRCREPRTVLCGIIRMSVRTAWATSASGSLVQLGRVRDGHSHRHLLNPHTGLPRTGMGGAEGQPSSQRFIQHKSSLPGAFPQRPGPGSGCQDPRASASGSLETQSGLLQAGPGRGPGRRQRCPVSVKMESLAGRPKSLFCPGQVL